MGIQSIAIYFYSIISKAFHSYSSFAIRLLRIYHRMYPCAKRCTVSYQNLDKIYVDKI